MFCALSQFLDRHVHLSDSSTTTTTSSSRSPLSEIRRRIWENITSQPNMALGSHDSPTANKGNNSTSSSASNTTPPSPTNSNFADNGTRSSSTDAQTRIPPSPSSSSLSSPSSPGPSIIADDEDSEGASFAPTRHNRRHLPVPSGPHTVGCVDLMCDVADHGAFFRMYYPTQKTDIHRHYKQWPLWLPRKEYVHGYLYFLRRNKKIFGKLANFVAGDVYVPVLWQAPLLRSDEKFPVLIVSHGLGGNRTTISTYSYELASYGFVVVAMEHRDGSASMTLCLQEQLTSSLRDADAESENGDENQPPLRPHHQHPHPYLRYFHHPHNNNSRRSINNNTASREDGKHCDVSDISTGDSALQFYFEEGSENRAGKGGRGYRQRQRRQNRRRSLRYNHSCSEEWRPFNHIKKWDDFDFRNVQMYHRADELSDVLDELIQMNQGSHINNALGISFKTAQFKNRLDFNRVAIIGHSFGAAGGLAALATDDRFKLCISLDGWMHPLDEWIDKNMSQPVMFLNMEQFQWERNVNRMIKLQEANKAADRPMLTLMGACHQSMTDFQFLVPNLVGKLMDVTYNLRPEFCMSACVAASLAFLYKHLDLPMDPKHHEILRGNHPHLISGTNVDLTIPDDGPQPPDRITKYFKEDS